MTPPSLEPEPVLTESTPANAETVAETKEPMNTGAKNMEHQLVPTETAPVDAEAVAEIKQVLNVEELEDASVERLMHIFGRVACVFRMLD